MRAPSNSRCVCDFWPIWLCTYAQEHLKNSYLTMKKDSFYMAAFRDEGALYFAGSF